MNFCRLPSLMVALFLQVAPLVRTVEPLVTSVFQPLMILFRLAAAATAVAGGAHAVSGATGLLSSASVSGKTGTPLTYRAQIKSDAHGAAKSYSATALPNGISVTSSTLGNISGTPTKAGTFSAKVTGWENNNRTGDSFTATVTFTITADAPIITQSPPAQTVEEGGSATLSVTVTSSETPTFRWIREGVEVPGATAATLTLNPVKLSDQGSYVCRVQNSGGIALSTPALLTVTPKPQPPQITQPPVPATVTEGSPATFTVVATGTGPLTYQWKRGVNELPGKTEATLSFASAQLSDAGDYTVRVSNVGGFTESLPVTLTVQPLVIPAPTITQVTSEAAGIVVAFTAIPGRTYTLEAAATIDATTWSPVAEILAVQAATTLTGPPASGSAAEQQFFRLSVR
jgi:hypothetical protein